MRKFLLLLVFVVVSLAQVSLAQAPNSGKDEKPAAAAMSCPDVIIVRPEFTNQNLGGTFQDAELLKASTKIANAFAPQFKNPLIISSGQIGLFSKCNAKVIVAKLKSYSKKPSVIGQSEGLITITADVYKTSMDTTPYLTKEFSENGRRHWGDSGPFLKAVDAVADKIERSLGSL